MNSKSDNLSNILGGNVSSSVTNSGGHSHSHHGSGHHQQHHHHHHHNHHHSSGGGGGVNVSSAMHGGSTTMSHHGNSSSNGSLGSGSLNGSINNLSNLAALGQSSLSSNASALNSKLFNMANNGGNMNNTNGSSNNLLGLQQQQQQQLNTHSNTQLTQQQIMMQSPSVNMAAVAAYGQQPQLMSNSLNGIGPGSLSNSSNNSNAVNDDSNSSNYNTQKQLQIQAIQWLEVEIKGLVKNLSPKLWQWTHLRALYLNDNNLMRLPPVVSSLVNLQCLDASNNKIRTLPAEIGDMTSLRELYLNHNQLRVLPFELGKLFKLQQLGLKGNPLTTDMMQLYMEPNGSQKLLIHLLDQLTITCPPPPRRPWVILAEPSATQNPCIFTTMCYNVLCDKYATRQYYGYCPAWALTWDYRKKLILDDIKNFNADVIALQELETEQFYNFFLPELKQYDYDGIFSPKSRAKTMAEQDKKHVDGCAIMFKTSRFQIVKDYLIEFNQIAMATAEGSEDMLNRVMTKDNIGLAALLEVKQESDSAASSGGDSKSTGSSVANGGAKDANSSGAASNGSNASHSGGNNSSSSGSGNHSNKQLLLVCTAHIHWDPDYCDVKLIQTLMFTNEIKMIIEQATREFRPQQQQLFNSHSNSSSSNNSVDCSSSIPVVICADLNSLPDSGVIEYLRTGRILANHTDFKELGYDSCLQKINTSERPSELSHNLKLDCAYDKDIMPHTNYTYDFKGMIDYIFYSRNLMRTVGLLGPLDSDWIKSNRILGFPHPHVPSDHLPLMVELELFNSNAISNNNNNNMLTMQQHQQMQQQQQQQQNQYHFQMPSNNSGNNLRNNNNQQQQHHHHNNHHHSSNSHNNGGGNNNNNSNMHHHQQQSGSLSANNGQQLSLGQMIKNTNHGRI